MRIHTEELSIPTKGFTDIIDITPMLEKILKGQEAREGQILVFIPGSTAGITTIEYEPGLKRDLKQIFEELIPMNQKYHHNDTWQDGNGYAHVRAAFLKPSLTIPFKDNQLLLGTWQQVVLVDFDNRQRNRRVIVQILANT